MSTIEGVLSRAAVITRWRAGQAVELLKIQGQIGELEGQASSLKTQLADSVLALYVQGQLGEEQLKVICVSITELQEKIQELRRQQEKIKAEQLPTQSADSSLSGQLICPKCGKPVPVRFCPDDGTQGVPKQ